MLIVDTPWYASEESGLEMVEEKRAYFHRRFGIDCSASPGLEFLTPDRLRTAGTALDLRWRTLKPFYGLSWALRPLRAKLRGQRAPSNFRIFVAEVSA